MPFASQQTPGVHVVFFYDDEDALAEEVARYLWNGFADGATGLVIATPTRAEAVLAHLGRIGLDVEAAETAGRLVVVDAAAMTGTYLVDHRPDPHLFEATVGGLLRRVADTGRRPVRVFGEMVSALWAAGRVTAAMEVEALWNRLASRVPLTMFCAYPVTSVHGDRGSVAELCALHSGVLGSVPGHPEPHPRIPIDLATRAFGGGLFEPRRARRFVTDELSLRGWGSVANAAALVVDELATNAVLHARSPFVVTVSCRDGRVRVAVADKSPAQPNLRDPASMELTGRGLRLVAGLSANWGTHADGDGGKVVWAELTH